MSEKGVEPNAELTILWITAGLGCDGESVALTAATQPSIEDLVMGGMPGMPRLRLLNPFYSYENADEYIRYLELGAGGDLDPFILVIEGSIPDEDNKEGGYWAALGADREIGEPIPTVDWIDRLARHAWAVTAVGTCAAYGGIHAIEGNPTGGHGLAGLSRLGLEIESRHSDSVRAGVPDPAR